MFISLYFSTICLLKVDPVFQQLIGPLTINRNPECCFPFLSLNCDIKCKRCLKIKILHLMLWYGTGNISVIKVCLKKHINCLNFNLCRDNISKLSSTRGYRCRATSVKDTAFIWMHVSSSHWLGLYFIPFILQHHTVYSTYEEFGLELLHH